MVKKNKSNSNKKLLIVISVIILILALVAVGLLIKNKFSFTGNIISGEVINGEVIGVTGNIVSDSSSVTCTTESTYNFFIGKYKPTKECERNDNNNPSRDYCFKDKSVNPNKKICVECINGKACASGKCNDKKKCESSSGGGGGENCNPIDCNGQFCGTDNGCNGKCTGLYAYCPVGSQICNDQGVCVNRETNTCNPACRNGQTCLNGQCVSSTCSDCSEQLCGTSNNCGGTCEIGSGCIGTAGCCILENRCIDMDYPDNSCTGSSEYMTYRFGTSCENFEGCQIGCCFYSKLEAGNPGTCESSTKNFCTFHKGSSFFPNEDCSQVSLCQTEQDGCCLWGSQKTIRIRIGLFRYRHITIWDPSSTGYMYRSECLKKSAQRVEFYAGQICPLWPAGSTQFPSPICPLGKYTCYGEGIHSSEHVCCDLGKCNVGNPDGQPGPSCNS